MNTNKFKALVIDKQEQFTVQTREMSLQELSEGEVIVQVAYSGVNYKDGLASRADGKIIRQLPMIPGIDLAGVVVSSADSRFQQGQRVIATGFGLGVSHHGGYSEFARLPANWLTPLPAGLSLREAMIVGTAGLTAAMSIQQLEKLGAIPDRGSVLVTGATGGVGSFAIGMLAARGYPVIASTGRNDQEQAVTYLRQLGAQEIVGRVAELYDSGKPLYSESWQAAVDPVGGQSLSAIISRLAYDGTVVVSGLTGGTEFSATVLPFILRGVKLVGIDSVYYPVEKREQLWEQISSDLQQVDCEVLVNREVGLEQLPEAFEDLLQGRVVGRILVNINDSI